MNSPTKQGVTPLLRSLVPYCEANRMPGRHPDEVKVFSLGFLNGTTGQVLILPGSSSLPDRRLFEIMNAAFAVIEHAHIEFRLVAHLL